MSEASEVWVTVEQFAALVGKSVFRIRHYCREHNALEGAARPKLSAKKDIGGRDWIILIEKKTYQSVAE